MLFFRSHPSLPITLAALGVAAIGAILPATPLARTPGFAPLPGAFFAALLTMVLAYLVLIEIGKSWFFRMSGPSGEPVMPLAPVVPSEHRLQQRRARRFSTIDDLPSPGPAVRHRSR